MELLAGVLVGAPPSHELPHQERLETPGRVGHFFIALDIARFLPLEEFAQKAGTFLDTIERGARAAGIERILVPGKIEADKERAALRKGIEIAPETWKELQADATRLRVTPPLPLGPED